MASNSEITASYRWCRKVCKQSGSSFFASFHLLAPERRQAMYALYAFSRISDDLSDDWDLAEIAKTNAEARTRLKQWQTLLHSQCDEASSSLSSGRSGDLLREYDSLWPALADAVQRFEIPVQHLNEIVQGVAMDLDQLEILTWGDLRRYCYHVASAVGLACLHIWRASKELPKQPAIDCGYAFQWTNILRDIQEDAAMGRIYLPQELFDEFSIDRQRWLEGQPTGDWQDAIREVASQAFELYDRGWEVIDYLSPDSRRMFSLMWRTYRALLEEVSREPQRLWLEPKVGLRRGRKLRLAAFHFVPALYRRLPSP
ncbi:MAG: phytoene/squalene synthase family protein [Pirellulaceae bacterium]